MATARLDPVAKRILTAWLSVFLLGWYISQIASHSYNLYNALSADKALSFVRDWSLLLQWSFMLNVFALGMFLVQIPRLQFRFRHLCLISVILIASQWIIFHPSSPGSVRALTERFYYWYTGVDDWTDAYSRVIAIDGEEAMIQSEHFYLAPLTGESSGEESGGSISSHIAGSFTVKIIPHSSAQLNPDNEVFCRRLPHVKDIGPDQEAELTEIPVLLAGVPPWTLEYSVLDYQTSEEKIITVSFDASVDSDVGNYPTDRHSKIFRRFTINGSVPGSYRLRSLGDAKGPGTVSLDPVDVSVCPEAFWSRNATHELIRPDFTLIVRSLPLEKELCRLDGGYLELFAYGVPPLTVSYIRHIGGKAPRDGDNITISHVESGNPAEISNLGKAKSFRSRINLGIFDLPTDYRYFITKIVDGLGMITEYAQDFDADSVIIHVHDRPEASLVCDANKPLEVLTMDNGAIDPSFLSKTVIPVSIVGKRPPFDLNYSITTPGGLIMERKMSSLIGNRVEIPVSEMGVYALGAVSDGKCSGIVSRQTCKVAPFVEPSVSVHSSLIETPCFGQIGFSFNLQFTGVSPWAVKYTMKRDDGPAKSFTVIARKPTEIVEIKPPNPGKYEVQFTEFTDSHYPRPVPIKSVRAVQSFHAPSFAALERYTKKLCVGDQVDLEVKLTGSGPWSLAYEVISGAARTSLLIPSISVSPFSFSSPPLNHSGVYYVELKSVLDSNGCETPITSPPAQVEVLDKRPTASFVSPSSPSNLSGANHGSVRYSFIEGKNVGLELFLGGIAPFRVEFEHSIDGNHWKSLGQQKFLMADRSLDVRRPGYYRISQVQDSFCVGSPTEPSLAELIPVEKPSVQLLTGADVRDVCIGRPAGFKVNITGQPPFILRYQDTIECETTGVKCQVDSTERQIRLAQSESEIPFETNVPGLRTVTLLSISDENYNKVELDGLAVGLIVHAEPTARFKGGNEQIHICTKGSLPNDGNLDELILTGQSPWILRIASSFESGAYRKELTEYNLTIPKTPFMFHPHQDFSNVGRYSFALKNVQDANGCSLRLQGGAENVPEHTAKVEVYPEPTLMFIDSRPYSCVGDIMEYHLSGIPPWRIQYRFIDAQGQMHDKNLEVDAKDGAGSDGASSLLSFISRSTFTSGGKKHSSAASDSEQSRRLILRFAQPGSFEFRSICHGPTDGEGWCCKNLTGDDSIGGPHFIHTLPSASINQGKHSMDVIREGSEAVMAIDLSGTPPFSFTYVRKSVSGVELDSHTVTSIPTKHYEIPLSQEGTFHLTGVSDAYCKVPRGVKRRSQHHIEKLE